MGYIYAGLSITFGLMVAVDAAMQRVPHDGTRGERAAAFARGFVNHGIPYGLLAAVVWPGVLAFGAFLAFLAHIAPR